MAGSILERLGWKFIRVRGSEYYRGRSQAISRIVAELNASGINPEATDTENGAQDEDALLTRVKIRAMQLMNGSDEMDVPPPPPRQKPGTRNTHSQAQRAVPSEPELPNETISDSQLPAEISTEPIVHSEPPVPVQPKPQQPRSTSANAEQISMVLPEDDLLAALTKQGFRYLDNRKSSGLIWVFYDSLKVGTFVALRDKLGFKAKLEKRGAKATNNEPAWCITGQK